MDGTRFELVTPSMSTRGGTFTLKMLVLLARWAHGRSRFIRNDGANYNARSLPMNAFAAAFYSSIYSSIYSPIFNLLSCLSLLKARRYRGGCQPSLMTFGLTKYIGRY